MEMFLQNRHTFIPAFLTFICLFSILLANESRAQLVDEPEFRSGVQEDGTVYLFHSMTLPLGYGYNLYRRPAESAAEENIRLNEEPIRSVTTERQLLNRLGGIYWELRATLISETEDREILYTLRNDHSIGMLASFLHHEVADALGRLWIDSDVEPDESVIYTLEVLNEFDQPIDLQFNHTVQAEPTIPEPPSALDAEHDGRFVTIRWNYPRNSPGEDDTVLRFDVVHRISPDEYRVMNPDVIIRDNARDNYEYEFTVPRLGQTYTFDVIAVDITGQKSQPGEGIEIEVFDNRPPGFITDVQGFVNDNGYATITWPIATEARAAGYNIYRAESSAQDAELTLITPEPVPVHQTSYVDSLAGRSGESELHFYRVTVISHAGIESKTSNAAMVHMPVLEPPPPPSSLEAEILDDGGVLLTWEAPEVPERFETWVVMRREIGLRATDTEIRVNADSLLENRFVDYGTTRLGLTEGAEYEYRVASQDGDKFTSEFLSVTVTIPKETPPEAPANLRALNENGYRVQLNWNPSGDPFIESYQLYRSVSGIPDSLIADIKHPKLTYRDEDVEAGKTYTYRISATDSFGNTSELSTPDTVFVRTFNRPRTVRNVRAEELEDGGVEIRWEPVPDSDLAGYRVFRSSIPTGVFEEVHPELIEKNRFVDPGGSRDMWYIVRVYDSSTNESRASEPVQAR